LNNEWHWVQYWNFLHLQVDVMAWGSVKCWHLNWTTQYISISHKTSEILILSYYKKYSPARTFCCNKLFCKVQKIKTSGNFSLTDRQNWTRQEFEHSCWHSKVSTAVENMGAISIWPVCQQTNKRAWLKHTTTELKFFRKNFKMYLQNLLLFFTMFVCIIL